MRSISFQQLRANPRLAYIGLFIASFVSILLTLGIELIPIGGIPGTVVQKLINLLSESLLLLLPYWILPRRTRWAILLPVLALPVLMVCAVWYMRFWGDLPRLSSLLVVSNLNAETIRSSLALWRFYDLIPPVIAIAVALLYFTVLRKGAESYCPARKPRLIIAAVSILLYLVHITYETAYLMKIYRRNGAQVSVSDFPEYFQHHFEDDIWLNLADLRDNGFLLSMCRQLRNVKECIGLRRDLTDEEKERIEQFISAKKIEPILSDSLIHVNQAKNLILIVVESLNSGAITPEVAPTLSQLIEAKGTVSALNIDCEISIGCSGDGQLLANTGLKPLTNISTAFVTGSTNDFPALPRLIGRNSPTVVFGDNGTPWNEANTFSNYGFEQIIVNDDYLQHKSSLGTDRAMMVVADSLFATMQQPFLLELVTASMHSPFNDKNIPDSLISTSIGGRTNVEQAYNRMVNYFDSSVAYLIDALKKHSLLNNTMIMLVSDHTTNATLSAGDPQPTMAFIATNTGVTERIERRALQSDVFPTILQLCGAADNNVWHGVGNHLFASDQTINEQTQATEISNLILTGNFFKSKFGTNK